MKKLLFLFMIFFCRIQSFSQTVAKLDSEAVVLYKAQEFQKALPLAEKALEIINKNGGENHPEYFNVNTNLAFLYKKTQQYIKSEHFFKIVADLTKRESGELNEEYALALNQLALLYEVLPQQDSAAKYYKAAIDIYQRTNKNSENYPVIINNLSALLERMRKYNDAEPLYILLAGITKEKHGENLDYASRLVDLADLYESMEKYDKAESLYIKTSDLYKQLLGDTSLQYAASLRFLGQVYYKTGQYKKAEPEFILSAKIRKQQAGETSKAYGVILNDLGLLYNDIGEYTKAEALYLQSMEIDKITDGENSANYATDLNNLALLYDHMSDYNKAITLYIQSKDLRKKIFGEESDEYRQSLHNLASAYEDADDHANAEAMYMQSLAITKKLSGENSDNYASNLTGLGLLYESIGLYSKAQALLMQASDIWKYIFGEHSVDYAISLHNLAGVFTKQGYYADAEKIYLKCLEIKKDVYGEDHFSYASTLTNLAYVYKVLHQFDKAEPLYKKAVEIKKKQLGEDHAEYATTLNNLSGFYNATGDYKQAIALYKQVYQIYQKRYGEQHSNFANLVGNMELSYQKLGDYRTADSLLIKENDLLLQNLLTTLTLLSEQDKQLFLNDNAYTFEIANSFLYKHGGSGALRKSNLNMQLVFKSLSLSDSRNMLTAIRNSKDSAIKKLFDQWLGDKAVLARQYSLSPSLRINGMDSLEKDADAIEKQLNRKSGEFKKQQKASHVTMEDIQHALGDDEVAIEFVRFQLLSKEWTDSIIYAAYVFKKGDLFSAFIPLCEEKQLQLLFASAGTNTTSVVNSFYRGAGTNDDNVSVAKGDSLYKLIWQPLEPYLKGINKISYSPAGKLYAVAFNALPAVDGKILMDKYELQQYTSTRQIALRGDQKNAAPNSIVLFGDATFSMDSLQLVKAVNGPINNSTVSAHIYLPKTRGNTNNTWNNLPGTAAEVNKIQRLFSKNSIATKLFVQQQANEENLKRLSGSTQQILHIATHGFFLPEPEADKGNKPGQGNTYSLANDPLLRSGLVLAGGNYTWSGKNPINGIEDGVVTAYEISQLDLSKTELVVLSACETALGDIKGSEGVFGLQRAFKMAGVNKLIVSLWQVPDKETAELMTLFYSNWIAGKPIEQSFYNAQAEMRKKYSPFYWAAFILVE